MFHLNSMGKGGAERVVSLLSDKFAEDGVQVIIATEWEEEDEYIVNSKVRRSHVGLSKKQEKASRLTKQWYRVHNLRREILREKPDLIFSFCIKANYRATMATLGLNIPVIISVRSDPKVDYVGKKNRLMNKIFLNNAAGCVFQTEEAKAFFDMVLQNKSTIICNPVNEKFLKTERQKAKKKIVCVGRMVECKNQMLLIQVFERILRKYPDYDLYFYGDCSEDGYKDKLQAYVNKARILIEDKCKEGVLELKRKVHFMGNSNVLEKEIADAAMFVLPSDYEGMPNALMEAMTLGLPCISTDCPCGGSRYWIEHMKNGQLFPIKNADALESAILYYIEHPKKAEEMGQNARDKLKSATVEKIYIQWKDYMHQVVGRGRR